MPKNYQVVNVRVMIGNHLMRACRAEEDCPWKPLLPEYDEEDVQR